MKKLKLHTNSAQETIKLGNKFSRLLLPRDVVLFEGELGGGKTTFIKGILKGLGYKKDVLSPSFTLVREYVIKDIVIYHADLYRLSHKDDLYQLGIDDFLYTDRALTLVEWGEKIETLLPQYIKLVFSYLSQERRSISISFKGYPKERLNEFNCF